nr:hypothetical protein [uncultured Mediterranean phage uvMED]
MTATAFDTHKVAKTLAKAGFPESQVEAQVDVLTEFSSELSTKKDLEQLRLATSKDLEQLRLATKKDLEQHRLATSKDLEQHRAETKKDLEQHRAETKKDLELLEKDLVNTLTLRMVGTGVFMASILKVMQLI